LSRVDNLFKSTNFFLLNKLTGERRGQNRAVRLLNWTSSLFYAQEQGEERTYRSSHIWPEDYKIVTPKSRQIEAINEIDMTNEQTPEEEQNAPQQPKPLHPITANKEQSINIRNNNNNNQKKETYVFDDNHFSNNNNQNRETDDISKNDNLLHNNQNNEKK
jgi:hypothetical protein